MTTTVELQLMSARSVGKDVAESALVYRLDEEAGLPDTHQTHPWAGKTVCALRDRLMIEWVLSFPESKKLLKRMADETTTAVRRSSRESGTKPKSGPKTVRVVVLCSDGAQLSPCFVERLYEHFSSGAPPIVAGLRVSRYHRDALRGAWGHSKNLVWQVSCIPTHAKVASNFAQIFQSRMWLNFDSTASSRTEKLFRKDPFTSNVDFTDMILDFASGTAYRKSERKTYYIRCFDVSQVSVDCWILTDVGYKSSTKSFRAAGVQPYSVHPVTGEAVFLLGRLTYGPFIWCDFGGFTSSRFSREGPRWTAARECYEETLGVLGTTRQLSDALLDFKTNNCFKVVNVDTQYVGHFLRVPYKDYPSLFNRKLKELADKPVEVDRMKWFPLSSMKSAVMIACSEQYGVTQHHITVKALTEDGTVDESRSHRLREPYVSTLCIANALNFLDSIAAIAKQEPKKRVPLSSSSSSQPRHQSPSTASHASSRTEDDASTDDPTNEHLSAEATSTSPKPVNVDSHCSADPPPSIEESSGSDADELTPASDEVTDDDSSSECEIIGQLSSCTGDSVEASEAECTLATEFEQNEKSSRVKTTLITLTGRRRNKHKSKKLDKKRKGCIHLYGMGAGSFTAMESYMNT